MRGGAKHVVYAGLLDALHSWEEYRVKSLETRIIQFPTEETGNVCIVQAKVVLVDKDGNESVYSDIGDASPKNVNTNVVPHFIRTASTRAKARVLGDILAVEDCLMEAYLSDAGVDTASARPSASARPPGNQGGNQGGNPSGQDYQKPKTKPKENGLITDDQIRAVKSICTRQNWNPPDNLEEWTFETASNWLKQYSGVKKEAPA
jgi:hypothetical protein